MPDAHPVTERSVAAPTRVRRIGCVSFLNAKPLIDGLEGRADPAVCFDVPARLLEDLESGRVDIALCPVIDYQRSAEPLEVVPVGGIGSDGPTLTVRLFSAVPLERLTTVHVDRDSHTSVALLQVLLAERLGIRPRLIPRDDGAATDRQALLLIGDKVVTDPVPAGLVHEMDLGQAWRELTGQPFLFAVWMTRAGSDLGDLPALLERTRRRNAGRIEAIVARHAPAHRWRGDLALDYLSRTMRYEVGPRELEAMRTFSRLLLKHRLIEQDRPLRIHRAPQASP